jgi:hypothetical protein
MFLRIAVLLALLGFGAACAGGAADDDASPDTATSAATPPTDAAGSPSPTASGEPPLSSTDLPIMTPPAAKPTGPTDAVSRRWITGVVTRTGAGPCFGLRDDAGRQYAVYNAEGVPVETGQRIKARVVPLRLRIYCGPGEAVSMLESAPAR